MASKKQYEIVGRHMSGKRVVGYDIKSLESNKQKNLTRGQIAFLAGAKQLSNCTGQLYGKDVILRLTDGKSMASLPTINEAINKEEKGAKNDMANTSKSKDTKGSVFQRVMYGKKCLGYDVKNIDGSTSTLLRGSVMIAAKKHKLENVRLQMYNGKPLLRSTPGSTPLSELPKREATEQELIASGVTPNSTNKENNTSKIKNNMETPLKTLSSVKEIMIKEFAAHLPNDSFRQAKFKQNTIAFVSDTLKSVIVFAKGPDGKYRLFYDVATTDFHNIGQEIAENSGLALEKNTDIALRTALDSVLDNINYYNSK